MGRKGNSNLGKWRASCVGRAAALSRTAFSSGYPNLYPISYPCRARLTPSFELSVPWPSRHPAAPCPPLPTLKLALTTPPPLLASPTLPSGRKRMPTPKPLSALAAQTTSQRSRRQVRFLAFRPALFPRAHFRPRASSHQPRERRSPAPGVMSTHRVPAPGGSPRKRAP